MATVDYEEDLLSWEAIGLILDMPASRVKANYYVAMDKLRKEMQDAGVTRQEFAHYLKLTKKENF